MLYLIPIENVGDIKINCRPEFLDTVKKLLSTCVKITTFKDLLSSILAAYPDFSIAFVDAKLCPTGQWTPDDQQIEISENLEFYQMAGMLVFECCNAQNPKFKNFKYTNFSNAEEYATSTEEAEYDTYKHASDICFSGIKLGIWPTLQVKAFPSLEDWMKYVKKESTEYNGAKSHFDVYVNFFNQNKLAKSHESENTIKITNTVRQQL